LTTPNIQDPALLALLQQFAAQQGTTQAGSTDLPVAPAAPVAEPAASVSIDLGDLVGNGGYGPGLFSPDDKPVTTFTGTLAQPVFAKQDLDYETKQPKFYDDGKPVPLVFVGLDVPVSERHPDGRATWFARGKDITELNRAATAAGVPRELMKTGFEVGATITVSYTEDRKNPSRPAANAAKIRKVTYVRPNQPVTYSHDKAPSVASPGDDVVYTRAAPVTAPAAPAAGPERPEGLTDEQFAVYLKALGKAA